MKNPYKEKRLLVDGHSSFAGHLSNLYDVDVSNSLEAELLVYSSSLRAVLWLKRERPGAPPPLQWSSNFWIYLIMFIHCAALLLGLFHFTFVVDPAARKTRKPREQPNLFVELSLATQ